MSEEKDKQHGAILLILGVAVAVSVLAFVAGVKSQEGMTKRNADDFGKVRLQDTIYRVEVIRKPYTPETVTMKDLKEKARQDKE